MDKYLIINADDFGMSRSNNLATMDLLKKGYVTSSTIMMPCAWAREACEFAKANPELAIGVHLTTTSEWHNYRWAPVNTSNTDSLRDDEGFMYHESDEFEKGAKTEEVAAELRAQIERAKLLGLTPSHIDNHMGSLYGVQTGRFDLLPVVFEIAAEYGLPFRFPSVFDKRMFGNETLDISIPMEMVQLLFDQIVNMAKSKGIAMPDYLMPHDFNGPQKDSYENFSDYMYEFIKAFPEGVTETYLHPAFESDELKGITGSWEKRAWEYRFYSDPKNHQYIKDCGIKLINYRDLAEMRK